MGSYNDGVQKLLCRRGVEGGLSNRNRRTKYNDARSSDTNYLQARIRGLKQFQGRASGAKPSEARRGKA